LVWCVEKRELIYYTLTLAFFLSIRRTGLREDVVSNLTVELNEFAVLPIVNEGHADFEYKLVLLPMI